MTKTKTTKKDYFTQIITLATEADKPELVEFAEKEIAALEKKAAKAKETAAKKKADDPLLGQVFAAVSDVFEPIADIALRVEGEEITAAKVAYRLRKLAEEGRVEKGEIVVEPEDGGKKRKIVGYKLAE